MLPKISSDNGQLTYQTSASASTRVTPPPPSPRPCAPPTRRVSRRESFRKPSISARCIRELKEMGNNVEDAGHGEGTGFSWCWMRNSRHLWKRYPRHWVFGGRWTRRNERRRPQRGQPSLGEKPRLPVQPGQQPFGGSAVSMRQRRRRMYGGDETPGGWDPPVRISSARDHRGAQC